MNTVLNMQTLAAIGARVAILSVGQYALPVFLRIREPVVECRVPTWTGIGDLLEDQDEVTLVILTDSGACLRWLFLRGPAERVLEPDWEGLQPPVASRVSANDLYLLLRIRPKRMELIDEQRGWGYRETADL